ncbi:MAG: transposase [Deinococcota bacterium]|nr:transposase [Deinococcota bacterium]
MLVIEYKAVGTLEQYRQIDEAIRTAQFVRNSCLRLWVDAKDTDEKVGKYDISRHTTFLRKQFEWCKKLNSTAVQAAGERAWSSIARFYDPWRAKDKKGIRPVGYPRFKKNCRSVEYKHSGWKLDALDKRITFTDGFGIGTLKLKGTWDLALYPLNLIKRVRLVKRADGYYVQLAISVDRVEEREPTGKAIGLDVGLESFYTDTTGHKEPNPRFLRKAEKRLKTLGRRISKKFKKGQKQTSNYKKAKNRLARKHLQVSRQRKDHAIKLARCVAASNDLIAYEDLKVRNMVKNRSLAKSISDASWTQFRSWLEYYGKVFGKITVAVPPQYTSQDCSRCGKRVQKALSTRTHSCPKCGSLARQGQDRDENAARNILQKGLSTVGHTGTWSLARQGPNAWGEDVRPTPQLATLDEPRIPCL